MIVTEQKRISIEEYLELEEQTGERHEYIGGEVRMMAGTELEHEGGDKFDCYRQISSLQSYVLIESKLETHDPAIYVRTWEGDKRFQEKKLTLEDTLDVLSCSVTGQDIYNFSV